MSGVPPNLDAVNSMICDLSNDIANKEQQIEQLKNELNQTKEESNLLSKEIQEKAKQITKLKKNNEELNKNLENNKITIEELTRIKEIHEAQNYELVLKQKNNLEKERNELETKYFEMKKNYENEQKKYLELDKKFYEYKEIVSSESGKIANLEEEIKKKNEENNENKKTIEKKEEQIKESMEIIKNLRKDNEKIKTEMGELRTETHNKVEEMKIKMEKVSQSVFSPDKILKTVAENIYFLFEGEFSLSLSKVVEEIIENFIIYTQSLFGTNDNKDRFIHNDENIYLYFLKDIYFYVYFYTYNYYTKKNSVDDNSKTITDINSISISSSDFTEEIINNLTNEIYKKNIINFNNESSEKRINEYLNNLKASGVNDTHLSSIKEYYTEKNKKFKMYILNTIKTLIKKCTSTFISNRVEMDNKILFDFSNFNREEYSFVKNNLQIHCDKMTNEKVDSIINILKYPPEKINKITFNNSFNNDLSEYNIQKILLNIMTYNQDILSLYFNNCKNFSTNIISYIMFIIQNLKLKVFGLESCKLNDPQIKIITEGLKDNKGLLGLMLRKNNITSQGGFYIADYLNNNTNLRQLFLGGNSIKDKGLKSLLNTIALNNKNLTNLDLNDNKFDSNDFDALIDYLKNDPILNVLDISGNKMELKSLVKLGGILGSLKNIKNINLSKTGITSDHLPLLLKSFNFEEITLDDNNLAEVGIIMLTKSLMGDKNLKKISLKNVGINIVALNGLLKALENAKEFKELHLENNNIDDNCLNQMKIFSNNIKYKIYLSKNMVNQELLYKDNALGKESNIILV